MTPDLYTEEFRNLKYLKSHQDLVRHFKESSTDFNKVQPWAKDYDPEFKWRYRIEFLEQVFDLRDDVLYIVEPCAVATIHNSKLEEYEDARLHEIVKPVIFKGNPFVVPGLSLPTEADIHDIEDPESKINYYISSRDMIDSIPFLHSDSGHQWKTISLRDTPLVLSKRNNFICLFSNKEWAEEYRSAVSKFIKNYFNTVSTISARL